MHSRCWIRVLFCVGYCFAIPIPTYLYLSRVVVYMLLITLYSKHVARDLRVPINTLVFIVYGDGRRRYVVRGICDCTYVQYIYTRIYWAMISLRVRIACCRGDYARFSGGVDGCICCVRRTQSAQEFAKVAI